MNPGKGIFKQAPLCMFTKDALRAYLILDFHRDSDAIKAVYNEVVEEGMEMNAHFHEMYNHIMIKYSERLPSSEYNQTASATQTEIDVDDESDFSSDEEGAHIQEFERETPDSEDSNKDNVEMNDPK
ncbi:uncharacterized protein LOC113679889 [Pocillopora damicornis]|uniref:uncharacterized protein LOC113679889 n=1 Tax=Pocillopora damicornis TaxID=46731 RepID=UPI000F54E5FC|nr:uncharacterized protein LOC113679889 [Pocillopora damicornis]